MNKVLKFIQYGLIVATVVPLLALIVTADTFSRVMSAISIGSAVFYYIIDLVKKGKLEEK